MFSEVQKLEGELPFSYPTFRTYFDVELKSNKNDVCNFCTKMRKFGSTKAEEMHKIWNEHLEDAAFRRNIYKTDIRNISNFQNTLVISFDYKQNITLPHTNWQPNILYYKRKWNVNCFNIVHFAIKNIITHLNAIQETMIIHSINNQTLKFNTST